MASIKELVDTALPAALVSQIRSAILRIDGVEGIHLLRTRQSGEDVFIDAHIVVDPRITVSEGHNISDAVRNELIARFDDVIDVLVHVDPEDDEALFEPSKPLTRSEVQELLTQYLQELKPDDFRLHYLNERIEIEIILPYTLSESPQQLTELKKRCEKMQTREAKIDQVVLFFKM